jgi:hypothetical protein
MDVIHIVGEDVEKDVFQVAIHVEAVGEDVADVEGVVGLVVGVVIIVLDVQGRVFRMRRM